MRLTSRRVKEGEFGRGIPHFEAMATHRPPPEPEEASSEGDQSDEEVQISINNDGFMRRSSRPQAIRAANADLILMESRTQLVLAMAAVERQKAKALEDQNILALFNVRNEEALSPDAREYLKLRRLEVEETLKRRTVELERGRDERRVKRSRGPAH